MCQQSANLRAAVRVADVPSERVALGALALQLELCTAVWIALEWFGAVRELTAKDLEPQPRRVDADEGEA